MLLQALARDLSLRGDEPLGYLPDLDGLVDVLDLCLGGERRGEALNLDLLVESCSFLLWLEFQLQHAVLGPGLEVEVEEGLLEGLLAFGRSF